MINNTTRNQKKLFTITFLISFLTFYFGVAHADTTDDLKKSITNNQAQIQALEKEIQEYNNKIANTREEATTLKQALANLEAQRKNLQNEISSATYKIENTQVDIENTIQKIQTTEEKINLLRNSIMHALRQKNNASVLTQDIFLLLGNTSLSAVFDSVAKNEDFTRRLNTDTAVLRTAREDLEATKLSYETQFSQLAELKGTLQDKQLVVNQNRSETNNLLKTTQNQESAYQKQLTERKEKKADLEKEILDFEAQLNPNVNVSALPRVGKGVLQYPLKNVRVTQTFGTTPFSTQNPQVYNGMGHNGVDFAAPVGTAIYSAADGVVIGSDNSDNQCNGVSFGRWVLIRHDNGLSTLYAHLSSAQVTVGQRVKSGEKIALSGNTGYSTGPHLHFTVYASDAVHVAGPTEYKSRVCGTYLIIPVAPPTGYLNPLSYL